MTGYNELISREALKEEITSYDREFAPDWVLKLIDNAPTVHEFIDKCGDNCEFERPQGEWIAREDMDYIDENKVVHNHFMCNKCGLIHDFIDGHTSQYNFCPNCGVTMRKGGAE